MKWKEGWLVSEVTVKPREVTKQTLVRGTNSIT